MDIVKDVMRVLWIILPAYVANGTPVIIAKLLYKLRLERHPIDFGRNFIDGKRLFGDSKSWEGLVAGILTGTITGYIQNLYPLIDSTTNTIVLGLVLSSGAMAGDVLGAFIKRRIGLNPGEPLLFVDQLLFIVVALGLSIALNMLSLSPFDWFIAVTLTFVLHIVSNLIAYIIGLKSVPW